MEVEKYRLSSRSFPLVVRLEEVVVVVVVGDGDGGGEGNVSKL